MKKKNRYWEIDSVRALALVLMLVQHVVLVWNLLFIGSSRISSTITTIGHIGALLFIFLVGLSSYLSYSFQQKKETHPIILKNFIVRGVLILGWGLVINIASALVLPAGPIYFGVLHFIGTYLIVAPLLIQNRWLSSSLLIASPVIAYLLKQVATDSYSFIALGITPSHFVTLDYWPLFPNFSFVLIGLEAARLLYTNGKRQYYLPAIKNQALHVVTWLGSHTLLIYLIHVPILWLLFSGIIYLLDY